jgi:serine phosphatase RsbU (regulator of sigma subunit)
MDADPLQVLLVEDCPVHADLICGVLNRRANPQFRGVWAETIADGIAHLRQGAIDVVLLDLSLPDSDGLETFYRLYREFPHVPIVILTARDDERLATQALQEGCQDYLVKDNVDVRLLERSLLFAIERHARRRLESSLEATRAQLDVARQIQQRLCPQQVPQLPGFDLAGMWYPAEATCGDFFDFFPMRDGSVGILVGDVCGHGLGPALLAAETRAYVRALALACDDVGEVLATTNRLLTGDLDDGRFVTLFFAKLSLTARTFVYASAGQRAYRITPDTIAQLDSTSPPLGIMPELPQAPNVELTLGPNELVLIPTDGMLEATSQDRELFGASRVLDLVARSRRDPAEKIVELVYDEVRRFTHNAAQDDDVTAVLLKVAPAMAAGISEPLEETPDRFFGLVFDPCT